MMVLACTRQDLRRHTSQWETIRNICLSNERNPSQESWDRWNLV